MKKNKNNKKHIWIIILVLVLLILIIIGNIIVSNNKQNKEINNYTSEDEFKNIEEVAKYLNSKFIKQEKSKEKEYNYDIYMELAVEPFTGQTSNQGFYNKLVSYSVKAIQYESFRVIDNKKNIIVSVKCDKEQRKILNIQINGESAYFENRKNQILANNITKDKITNVKAKSNELLTLIENSWKFSKLNIGNAQSSLEEYDIYFERGIEVRKVKNKVFNIVFTQKYSNEVVENIYTKDSIEDIKEKLGKPTFENTQANVIGYKADKFYIFINDRNEISIYPVIKENGTDKIIEYEKKYLEDLDIKSFVASVQEEWKDYDIYDYDTEYMKLMYTLRGYAIEFNTNSVTKIDIYKNYTGDIYEGINWENIKDSNIPTGMKIHDEDAVFLNEISRNNSVHNAKYILDNIKMTVKDENTVKKFANSQFVLHISKDSNSTKLQILSLNSNSYSREIEKDVYCYQWLDDNFLVYTIKNVGIFVYNPYMDRETQVVSGNNEEFKINSIENYIINYDEKKIKIQIQ